MSNTGGMGTRMKMGTGRKPSAQPIVDIPDDLANLTPAQRRYLIERMFSVQHPISRKPVPLILNAMQLDIIESLGGREITVKSRRAGLSTAYIAICLLETCTVPGTRTELYAHNRETAELLHEQLIVPMYASLPDWIRPYADLDNVRELNFRSIGSSIQVNTAGQSRGSAESKGQARTIHNLILTEMAFYSHPEVFFHKIENCVPWNGRILIDSTPNGRGPFYRRFKRAQEDPAFGWRARFYPWWWDQQNQVDLDADEEIEADVAEGLLGERNPHADERRGRDQLTPEQIKWRRKKISDTQPEGHLTALDRFITEFPEDPETCFLTSGRPCFLPRYIKATCSEKGPEQGHEYRIGHDASTGSAGGHPCGTCVIDITAGEVVYQLRDHCDVAIQADRLQALQERYNNGVIICESNFPGEAVLALLRRAHAPNLYHYVDRELKKGGKTRRTRKPGFNVNHSTKGRIFTELELALHNELLSLSPGPLLEDLGGFSWDEKDNIIFEKIEGASSHGDVGIACCLAWEARKYGVVAVG